MTVRSFRRLQQISTTNEEKRSKRPPVCHPQPFVWSLFPAVSCVQRRDATNSHSFAFLCDLGSFDSHSMLQSVLRATSRSRCPLRSRASSRVSYYGEGLFAFDRCAVNLQTPLSFPSTFLGQLVFRRWCSSKVTEQMRNPIHPISILKLTPELYQLGVEYWSKGRIKEAIATWKVARSKGFSQFVSLCSE